MEWEEKALRRLEGVPDFVRPMAARGVEKLAVEQGHPGVTVADAEEALTHYVGSLERDRAAVNIAVVRCEVVSEVCPGVGCLRAFADRRVHFSQYGSQARLIGFFTCGGCPGRRVGRLVNKLKNYGVSVVHLSSCLLLDGGDYPRCPHQKQIRRVIEARGIKVWAGTHH